MYRLPLGRGCRLRSKRPKMGEREINYFFDLHDGEEAYISDDASYFASDEEAGQAARRYLLEAARDVLPSASAARALYVVVRDEKHAILELILSFVEREPLGEIRHQAAGSF